MGADSQGGQEGRSAGQPGTVVGEKCDRSSDPGIEHPRLIRQFAGGVAAHSQDPFDRILVAQARVERIPIVSKDLTLAAYGVEVIW